MTFRSSVDPLDVAAKKYARMGERLYREKLTKAERRELVAERHNLVRQYGPRLREQAAGPTAASKKYVTVRKPIQAKYVLLTLGPKREVLSKREFLTLTSLRDAVASMQ